MSWQAMAWADGLEYNLVGPLAYRVLIKYANVANQRGEVAWRLPSEMATELGVSKRSIQRATKELTYAALLLEGDQSFVKHIRADRRPIVYDLNLHYKREFEQPELAAWDGVTELSTGDDGVTPQGQTGRQLVSHIERSINSSNSSTKSNPSTRVDESEEVQVHRLVHQPCPLRAGKEHDFTPSTPCSACGLQITQRWHRGDVFYLDDLLAKIGGQS